jgi:hypothetical protein
MPNITSTTTAVNRKVSPGTTSQSRDVYGAYAEAGRNLLSNIKPKELSKRIVIENALYDQVDRYKCPDDLDQKNIMQIYKLDGIRNIDTFYHPVMQTTNRRYDQHRLGDRNLVTIEWDKGMKFIKMPDVRQNGGNPGNGNGNTNDNGGLTISTMDSLTETGTWNTFGNVTNLIEDNLTFVAGRGSFRFDINTSSDTGGIESFDVPSFSLEDYMIVGKVFTWLNVPNLNQIQTVQLEMYSSPGNGYSIVVTHPHDADTFQTDWNLLGFILDPETMTTIGTPDPTNLTHVKITFVTNGTLLMNGVRLDNIVARRGRVYGIQYISKYMFMDTEGLWKENPTTGSDEVMLEFEAYQLFLQECACVIGQEIFTDTTVGSKGQIGGRLGQMKADLTADYRQYKRNYKAEFMDEQQNMYNWGVNFGYNNRGQWSGHHWDHTNDMQ